MDPHFFNCLGYMAEGAIGGYVEENGLEPAVSQLKEFDAQLRLREDVHATNESDDFQALVKLQVGLELDEQLLQHEVQRLVDVVDDVFDNADRRGELLLQTLHVVRQIKGFFVLVQTKAVYC